MLVGRVVQHHVKDDSHLAIVHLLDEFLARFHGPVFRRDVPVIAYIITEILLRALEKRREPDRLDPEVLYVIKLGNDAIKVADAVTVGIHE